MQRAFQTDFSLQLYTSLPKFMNIYSVGNYYLFRVEKSGRRILPAASSSSPSILSGGWHQIPSMPFASLRKSSLGMGASSCFHICRSHTDLSRSIPSGHAGRVINTLGREDIFCRLSKHRSRPTTCTHDRSREITRKNINENVTK